ncbi:MAG: elongation factor Ts [Alphaproteobacteria bacterium]|nr:elongation factor Ts [Alphaproteobacteria bacterium]
MEITAQLVKQLRDKTGAGMMDCKRALVEADGDMVSAEEYLRKKGLMDAKKKSARTAADGLVAIAVSEDKQTASIVELNSETDFVARNEKFQELSSELAKIALKNENVLDETCSSGKKAKEEIDQLISLVGENITFRRAKRVTVSHGVISSYMHSAVQPNMGKIGVLVAIETEGECCPCTTEEFGKKLAMHIAAANPTYFCSKCVPQEVIDKEKEIALAQAKEIGQKEEIAQKMAEGRAKKYIAENAFMEQIFVMDGKTKISDLIEKFNKDNGFNIKVTGYTKFVLGEGIEKPVTNFAEEVASFTK